ncbi:MAG: sulfotransferase, partial [Rhodanobacteraceae bacterium]
MEKRVTPEPRTHPVRVVTADDAALAAPIFLTGFARSGTTWVNRLMRDYFDAGFVNEGQFIVDYGRRVNRYGDLRLARNRERLVTALKRDDFFSILKENYQVEIDWRRIAETCESFAAIVKDILAQIAERMGRHRIGSKYPVFGRHLPLLNSLFPDCRVIHVVRDGRDCALSHLGVTWGHRNAYTAAIHWRAYMAAIRLGAQSMGERYCEIRYEDLLQNPESSMGWLERFVTGNDQGTVTKRFLEDRGALKPEKVARWRQLMPPRDQAVFEYVAGDMLKLCGYPLTGVDKPPSFLFKIGCLVHDRVGREKMYWARKV